MKMSKKSKVIIYILLTAVAIYFLAPFAYMFLSTFKTEAEAIAYPPRLFPAHWNWENFKNAWESQPFGTYLLNSVIVTVMTTAGQVLSCSLVAYGFARYNFKGKNILFMILLSTMMIPWDVTMIPQYMEFNLFGWINTLKPLIVPAWFSILHLPYETVLNGNTERFRGGSQNRRCKCIPDLLENFYANPEAFPDSGWCIEYDYSME